MQEGGIRVSIGISRAILSRSQEKSGHHLTRIGVGTRDASAYRRVGRLRVLAGKHGWPKHCPELSGSTYKPRGGRQRRLAHKKARQLPSVSLRGPKYRENSHANHTWHLSLRKTACFLHSEWPPVWVRFPSLAPLPAARRDLPPAFLRSKNATSMRFPPRLSAET
jgi:hypothetical protein